MSTGLYRVYKITKNNKTVWSYRIHNKIVKKEFYRTNIMTLKALVNDAGFLWGIVNKKDAENTAKETNVKLKDLQGRYGIQIK